LAGLPSCGLRDVRIEMLLLWRHSGYVGKVDMAVDEPGNEIESLTVDDFRGAL